MRQLLSTSSRSHRKAHDSMPTDDLNEIRALRERAMRRRKRMTKQKTQVVGEGAGRMKLFMQLVEDGGKERDGGKTDAQRAADAIRELLEEEDELGVVPEDDRFDAGDGLGEAAPKGLAQSARSRAQPGKRKSVAHNPAGILDIDARSLNLGAKIKDRLAAKSLGPVSELPGPSAAATFPVRARRTTWHEGSWAQTAPGVQQKPTGSGLLRRGSTSRTRSTSPTPMLFSPRAASPVSAASSSGSSSGSFDTRSSEERLSLQDDSAEATSQQIMLRMLRVFSENVHRAFGSYDGAYTWALGSVGEFTLDCFLKLAERTGFKPDEAFDMFKYAVGSLDQAASVLKGQTLDPPLHSIGELIIGGERVGWAGQIRSSISGFCPPITERILCCSGVGHAS